MLDSDLIGSLSKNKADTLHLTEIESVEEEDWAQLCALLQHNTSIKIFSLCLPSNLHSHDLNVLSFRQSRVSKLIFALQAHPSLQDFELSLGYLDESLIHDIIELIYNNKNIQALSLPFNQLESWHLHLLFPAIHDRKNIHALNLHNNWLQSDSTKLIKNIAISRKMSHLDVSFNNLGNSAVGLLLMPMESSFSKECIEHLDLSRNNINKFGIFKLFKKLTNPYRSMQLSTPKLILNYNPISCLGGKSLAKLFKLGFEFDEIHLRNTDITDKTVVTLCESMTGTKDNLVPISVQVLNLQGLDIKFNGSAAIANLIRKSLSLEEVSLSYDRINASNKLIISEALRSSLTLKKFHFLYDGHSNHYSEHRAQYRLGEHFLDIVKDNNIVEHVELCNTWSGRDSKAYSDIMLENLNSLDDLLKILNQKPQTPDAIYKQKERFLPRLNLCNTYINRLDNYYEFDHRRGPANVNDPSRNTIFLLKKEFESMKHEFRTLSMDITLYETVVKKQAPQVRNIYDRNVSGIIHDFVGNGLHNIFLTNFMMQKSKEKKISEEKKEDKKWDIDIMNEEKNFNMVASQQKRKKRWNKRNG